MISYCKSSISLYTSKSFVPRAFRTFKRTKLRRREFSGTITVGGVKYMLETEDASFKVLNTFWSFNSVNRMNSGLPITERYPKSEKAAAWLMKGL